jgi:hypothetical protein
MTQLMSDIFTVRNLDVDKRMYVAHRYSVKNSTENLFPWKKIPRKTYFPGKKFHGKMTPGGSPDNSTRAYLLGKIGKTRMLQKFVNPNIRQPSTLVLDYFP